MIDENLNDRGIGLSGCCSLSKVDVECKVNWWRERIRCRCIGLRVFVNEG